MKLHRAATLLVMILAAVVLLGVMLATGLAEMGARGLVALAVVVAVAAVAGIAFSWRRYFPGRDR